MDRPRSFDQSSLSELNCDQFLNGAAMVFLDKQRSLDVSSLCELLSSLRHWSKKAAEFSQNAEDLEFEPLKNQALRGSFAALAKLEEKVNYDPVLKLPPPIKVQKTSNLSSWEIFWGLGPDFSLDEIWDLQSNLFSEHKIGEQDGKSIHSPRWSGLNSPMVSHNTFGAQSREHFSHSSVFLRDQPLTFAAFDCSYEGDAPHTEFSLSEGLDTFPTLLSADGRCTRMGIRDRTRGLGRHLLKKS